MARQRRPKIIIMDSPEQSAKGKGRVESKGKGGKESRKEKRLKNKEVEETEEKVELESSREKTVQKSTPPKKKKKQAEEEKPRLTRRERYIQRYQQQNAPPPPRPKRPSVLLTVVFGAILLSVLAAFIFIPLDRRPAEAGVPALPQADNCLGIHPDLSDWEIEIADFQCESGYWSDKDDFADWLLDRNVSYRDVIILQERLADKGYPAIAAGNPFTILHLGNLFEPQIIAYQPQSSDFVLLKTSGGAAVKYHRLDVQRASNIRQEVHIQTDLADAMFNREFGLKLTEQLESALQWKVDLFHLTPGDNFDLLFEQFEYESGFTDIGQLVAIRSTVDGESSYAFYYDDGKSVGYYDEEGYPMKSGFLKAPLKYYRISSAYNLQRSDPFNGKVRPHLGTDYAAPAGTPILAVADGVVSHAEFKGNNGNYVKITHSEEIQTQYLHLQEFGEGIVPGRKVRQGDVIGFVGMTGRATGPHVCFRFWKNGEQVDHRKETGYRVAPRLDGSVLEDFLAHRDSLWQQLDPI